MTPKEYFVWIVNKSDDFLDVLISKLVKRGYTVGPLAGHLVTKNSDNPIVVASFTVHRYDYNAKTDVTPSEIYDDVYDIMKLNKQKFMSIVVNASGDALWNVGNLSIDEEKKAVEEALKKVN